METLFPMDAAESFVPFAGSHTCPKCGFGSDSLIPVTATVVKQLGDSAVVVCDNCGHRFTVIGGAK